MILRSGVFLARSFCALISLAAAIAQTPYLISTYAGGVPVPTAAVATSVAAVSSAVTTDPFGNAYFSSEFGSCIFKLDSRGFLIRVAGTCSPGFSGNGGPAVNAQMNAPAGLAVDANGNLYFADGPNHRVRVVSSTGIMSTVAGTGTAGYSGDGGQAANARLNYPNSVALDSAGNLYITDSGNHVVRKVSAGIITTFAGNNIAGDSGDGGFAIAAQFQHPGGIAIDSGDNIYISDSATSRVRRISQGMITTIAGTGVAGFSGDNGPASGAQLNDPWGLAFDSSGSLYIADTYNSRIRKVAVNGVITTVAGGGVNGDGALASNALLSFPEDVSVDAAGNLYIADPSALRLRRVNPQGVISTAAGNGQPFSPSGDGGPAAVATPASNFGIATDGAGNLYVADVGSRTIRKVTTSGAISTIGSTGFGTYPISLAADSTGNVYFAGDGWVSRMTSNATVTRVAGTGVAGYSGDGGPATSAQISPFVYGLAVDPGGNIYFSDYNNYRIRKVTAAGVISTVVGNGTSAYYGDGVPGTSATVSQPLGLGIDGAGNVFFTDFLYVRKLAANGIVTTVAGTSNSSATGDGRPATNTFMLPDSLAVDAAGNLYIGTADSTIRKVSSDGIMRIIAGTGASGYSGDGGPATAASFFSPNALAVDSGGRVYISDQNENAVRVLVPEATQPLLVVTSTHAGNFLSGQTGTYTINVSNAAGAGSVNGLVRVTEVLTPGFTTVSMSGSGWSCSSNACSTSDPLADGHTYSPITVTVAVDPTAPPQVTNQVAVSLAGAPSAGSEDVTFIVPPTPVLEISATHVGNFMQGESNASYTLTVGNQFGAVATSGTVSVAESLPSGLSLVSMGGDGWTCSIPSATCNRGDALAGGSNYPPISVGVNVGQDAAAQVVNRVTASGGASPSAVASDVTPVATVCDISGVLTVSVTDVQRMVYEVLGLALPTHDLNHDGLVNVADIEKMAVASLGLGCHY